MTIYKRYCDNCGKYYESQGKKYCSRKCIGISIIKSNKERVWKEETLLKKSEQMKGNKHKLGIKESIITRRKKSERMKLESPSKRPEVKEKLRISSTKTFLLDSNGNKEIYPPIFDLCWCGCRTIVYGGQRFAPYHQSKSFIILSDGTHYPPIPDLCHCNRNCGIMIYDGHEYAVGHNSYIDGRTKLPYCEKFDDILRESIRLRDNHTCQLCNKTQLEEGKRLTVHHIHYDKKNCYPDLISLCNSCNSKVNYKRSYYESFFMNKLNYRLLLFWTRYRNIKEET